MTDQKRIFRLSSETWMILVFAIVKFSVHLYMAPGYGFFGDEFYTIALSRHLAFGYVDLPPLVPALAALSRALLGDSLFAYHIFPALAGAATLVFVCLITREFGGKAFAVAVSALGFIAIPLVLGINSIFCYDGFDQLALAGFLYVLVRFLRTGDRRLWPLLGLTAGLACLCKVTILFLGPGFLIALLVSKYRRDLLTPWPWLGAALFALIVSPYVIWEFASGWPTIEYWRNYGATRMYRGSLLQVLSNLLTYMNPLLLPLWLAGLYRVFRRMDKVDYSFLGILFAATLTLMLLLNSAMRMLAELFFPLLAAAAVFAEELFARVRWGWTLRTVALAYLLATGCISALLVLPILPLERVEALSDALRLGNRPVKEFNGQTFNVSPLLSGRRGYEELVRDVADVYHALPPEERAVAGIFSDWYMPAGAVDQLGPKYGLPHAVSGSLTYYLWGPGYSWEVMLIITDRTNRTAVFFEECALQAAPRPGYDAPLDTLYIFVCRKARVPADKIWTSMKSYR
jgi:hypothetical protein